MGTAFPHRRPGGGGVQAGGNRPQSHRAPHHRPGQGRGVGLDGQIPLYHPPVPHDRDPVGGPQDLVELVAHQGHRPLLALHPFGEHVEQLLGLGGRQHRGRLVEDDDAGLAAQTFDYLHPLADAGGQVTHPGIGVHLQPVFLRYLPYPLFGGRRIDPALLAEGRVLPHREVVHQAVVLVDHPDAPPARLQGVEGADAPPVELHHPLVGQGQAEDDPHQGGLARPVLA